jgi:2-polyprenyl-3-methyl-5-hydroxy-6-metoxy-1,4-benzoquinol methylase
VKSSKYAAAFGAQWKKYRRTQLDSYTGTSISRDRARRCIGEDLWAEFAGKQVLECGCGAGRFTETLLDRGAYGTLLDLSDAVEANEENFPQNATHRIAQADIQNLPFAPQQFDVVFCLGVIQYTPCPEETISSSL